MKKNIVSGLLGALLSLGVFALTYFFLDQSHLDKFLPRNKTEAIIYYPMILLAPLAAITIHELGHLITGLFFGHKLKLFVIGFLGMKKHPFHRAKLSGWFLVLAGAAVMTGGNTGNGLYLLLALLSGVLVMVSTVINAQLAKRIGLLRGAIVNYSAGLVGVLVILLIIVDLPVFG